MDLQFYERWNEARRDFNYPAISKAKLVESLDFINTSQVDFQNREVSISSSYLGLMSEFMDVGELVDVLFRHELGHFTFFPRELSSQLLLMANARETFGEPGTFIYHLFSEFASDYQLVMSGLIGEELSRYRAAAVRHVNSIDPANFGATLNRLLGAHLSDSYGFEMPELSKIEADVHNKIIEIPFKFNSVQAYTGSISLFGEAIKPLLPVSEQFEDGHGSHMEGYSDENINTALSEILRNYGMDEFARTKEFVESERNGFVDRFEQKSGGAGLGQIGKLEFNDYLLPMYKRWASIMGIQVGRRTQESKSRESYPMGVKDFELGSEISKIAIFQSLGIIGIPGISKEFVESGDETRARNAQVPDLIYVRDSSGSIGRAGITYSSPDLLAGFILGRQYFAAGAKVGAMNFSDEIAFSPPSRDLENYYKVLAANWGGGTQFDTKKVDKLFRSVASSKKIVYTSQDKVSKGQEPWRPAQHLDFVLATDGLIPNIDNIVSYLSGLGSKVRPIVLLSNPNYRAQWEKNPNVKVFYVPTIEDLVKVTIGLGKNIPRYTTQAAYTR